MLFHEGLIRYISRPLLKKLSAGIGNNARKTRFYRAKGISIFSTT